MPCQSLTVRSVVARLRVVVTDYRSEKADSIEGKGVARSRWFVFLASLPSDVLNATGWTHRGVSDFLNRNATAVERRKISEDAKERADLIGFWVMWHTAGGFEELENEGWHRATIFRKIKRFRDRYGVHPDEFEFDWLKVDFDKAWWGAVGSELYGTKG